MNQPENRFADEDPRLVTVAWANCDDEWVRYLDVQIPFTGGQNIDKRTLLAQSKFALELAETKVVASRAITEFSEFQGLPALTPVAVCGPHEGPTIHHSENGTRKTGYPRCVQSPAGNRTSGRSPGESE
jgi:hypothetical protein